MVKRNGRLVEPIEGITPMARPKQYIKQVAVKLDHGDLAELDRLLERHRGRHLAGIRGVQTQSDVLRLAVRTLALLGEPFDDAEALHMQELAVRFGTSPLVVVSAMLNDANARAIVKRNLDDLAGRR